MNQFDEVAALIRSERARGAQSNPAEPYRGVAALFNADSRSKVDREDWFLVPGHPDVLLRRGHVQITDRMVPVSSPEGKDYLRRHIAYRALELWFDEPSETL